MNPEKPQKHPIFWQPIEKPIYFNKTIAILSAPGGNTFFHWIIDVLPRYEILRQALDWFAEIDYFIVNDTAQPFQSETLRLLQIPPEKIISGADYPHIVAERLLVPSFVRHQTCNIGSWAFQFLRRELIQKSTDIGENTGKRKRLYISREKASSRRISNEEAVFNILSIKGFEKVFLEALPMAEQIMLFASADCVIAPHGAVLTNLVFCPFRTKH